MATRPRILLITTGGTITMARDQNGALVPCRDTDMLLERVPELSQLAEVELLPLVALDSCSVQPELWLDLSRLVFERVDRYDGFVVTHGTDTLSYTAAALSFMLQELPKPVVVTGAQLPIDEIGTDGRGNLINAVRVASADIAEVAVVFGTQIIFGTRAKKTSVFDMQAITSVNEVPLGNIGLFIRFNRAARTRGPRKALMQPFLDPEVGMLAVYPGCRPELIEKLAASHHGLVLEGYGAGSLPTEGRSLIPAIKAATQRGVPVVVCTQCVIGSTQMELYDVGRDALHAGAIPAMDMTPEAALVKLMWVLGQTKDMATIESMMLKPFVNEMNVL